MDHQTLLRQLYRDFNARQIDAVLAHTAYRRKLAKRLGKRLCIRARLGESLLAAPMATNRSDGRASGI